MALWLNLAILLLLFLVLGFAADMAVRGLKDLASTFRLPLALFGVVLGLMTSMPEFMVGINATLDGAGSLAVGNLLGGTIVIFGLILGTSTLLGGGVPSGERLSTLLVTAGVIASPVILGLDGTMSFIDGIAMVLLYMGLVAFQYEVHKGREFPSLQILHPRAIARALLTSIAGMIVVILAANWIVVAAESIAIRLGMDEFLVGILLFSLGTNLPEISIAITSWKKKSADLSLSHLVSSAFTNVLILGTLSVMRPLEIEATAWNAYLVAAVFYGILLAGYVFFSWTGGRMDRREGMALLGVYIAFLIAHSFVHA